MGTDRVRRGLSLAASLLVSLLVSLAACGAWATSAGAKATSTTGSAPKATIAPTPKQWDPRIAPIAHEVEKLRKLEFEHPVAVEFLSEAEFEKKVAVDKGKLSASDKRSAERSQSQLRAVGLIGPDVDLLDATSSLQQSGVLAYYEDATKSITVKGTNVDDIATRVTLAHELTHALQDRHFDLTKLQRDAAKTHSGTVVRTVIEGDAVRIQNDYVDTLSKNDQLAYAAESAQQGAAAQTEQSAAGVPESLSVLFEAPYDLGPIMLDAVLADRKDAGIDALFRHPPTSDSAYLTPSTLLDGSRFTKVAAPKLRAGEKRSGPADTFGAFALYQVLASRIDPATALTAADGWGGDAMTTFTKDGATCLRSNFVGRDREKTTAIGDALSAWAAAMPAGAAEVQQGRQVSLTACDPGSAGTEAPNRALGALILAATRDGLFLEVLKQGAPVPVAVCSADTLVRDPVFTPLIDAAVDDPNAQPDADQLAAIRNRVPTVFRECSVKSTV
jgi:hypothetical protein